MNQIIFSGEVRAELKNLHNELWLSPITLWAVHLLAEKKRIQLRPDPARWIQSLLDTIPFREAVVTHAVALMSRRIDLAHQDPADERLLHSHQFSTLAAR